MGDREYRTAIGESTPTGIRVMGTDIGDLMRDVSFGELAYWLAARRRPTAGQRRVFEAVLVGLADHGFTPTALAARLTYYSAPDALQGAIAAGLLGGGSRFLGVTEDTGRYLSDAVASHGHLAADDAAGWDAAARGILARSRAEGRRRVPGLGHPVHTSDPRVAALVGIARAEGVYGPHLALFEAIGRVHPDVLGVRLPLNGAGVCGAALVDAGLPVTMLRGFALLARTAGLIGQLAEEEIDPIAPLLYADVSDAAVYAQPDAGPASASGERGDSGHGGHGDLA